MKVEVKIPEGKYCDGYEIDGCRLFVDEDAGRSYCNLNIDDDIQGEYVEMRIYFIKHPDCPSLKEAKC